MATIQALSSFVPTQISGCQLWLDAADSTTFTLSGNNISSWRDKSGSNNNATVETGTPTYSGNGVVFTGSQMLNTPLTTVNNTQTFFCVLTNNATSGHIASVKSSTLNTGYNYMITTSAQNLSRFGGTAITTGATLTAGARCLFGASVIGSGNSYLYLNGSQTGFASGTASVSGSGATLSIGAYYYVGTDPAPVGYLTGTINEMIMYYATLTLAQRQQVEGYLAWKWSLQGSLPSSHPYYYVAPNTQNLGFPVNLRIVAPTQSFSQSSTSFLFFRPTSITGCVLWLDGTDPNATGVQPANNATVSTWSDKSGNANNVTGGSGQFQTNKLNNLSGIYFPTTSYSISKAGLLPAGNTGATVFILFAGTGADVGLIAQTGSGGVACNSTGRIVYINTSVNGIYSTLYCGSAQTSTTYTANTNFLLSDVWVNTGSGSFNHFSYSTGNSFGSAAVSGTNIGNTTAKVGDNLLGSSFTGYMYEMIIYSGSLTDAQRQQVEGYLAWKWGLNGQLPSNHPYKNSIPGLPILLPTTRNLLRASFSPRNVSGIQLWLDGTDPAGTGVVPSNGSSLTTWVDKSGVGNTATGGTAVTVNSTGINNLPVVSFTSAPSYFNSTDLYSNRSFSVFIVARRQAANSVAQGLIGGTTSAVNQNMIILFNSATTIGFSFYGNDISAPIPAYTGNTATEPSILFSFNYTPGTRTIYVNGSLGASDGNTTNLSAAVGERIGYWGNGTTNFSFTGFIGEIIVLNAVPTTTSRQSTEGYLAWKWGLQGSLPATHPFKNFPPPPN